MKRSEKYRQSLIVACKKRIEEKEQAKLEMERYTRGEINILNKQIASLNRELDDIRDGGELDEEI